jgi:DNA-binding transcriptional regulator LsrR (DeoR family)
MTTHDERRQQRQDIAKSMKKKGSDIDEVAEEFHVSRTTVCNACKEHGVSVPRKARPRRPDGKAPITLVAIELLHQKVKQVDIANMLDVTRQRIQQINAEVQKAKSQASNVLKSHD